MIRTLINLTDEGIYAPSRPGHYRSATPSINFNLGSGPINDMQLCLIRRVRILGNKRKTKLFAFSSIVCQEADPPDQTLRVRWILPLSALERLENR